MTELSEPYGYPATVNVLDGFRALTDLRNDLARPGAVCMWIFLCDELWLHELLEEHLKIGMAQLLSDHRQRSRLRPFVQQYKNCHVATWATNRTMHDKTILFPNLHLTYITTANITRGAWTLSQNTFLRIDSKPFADRLTHEFHAQWLRARPLLASERG